MIKPFDDDLFRRICDLTREAGRLALSFFNPGERTSAGISYKQGNSPVTVADKAADDFLRRNLGGLMPHAAWLSEETIDAPARLNAEWIFIVDPIDGTRAFISGDARWAVSVALVHKGSPQMAVLHAPALGHTYTALRGNGAWRNDAMISARKPSRVDGGAVAGPKPFADRLQQTGTMVNLVPKIPSLALRFAAVAAGELDAAFASADAHEWDIAAADLILHEAGACLVDANGNGLRYNRSDLRHGPLFAAPAGTAKAWVDAARRAGI